MTTAQVANGSIWISPSPVDVFRVAALPGVAWSATTNRFMLRATPANVALVRLRFPHSIAAAAPTLIVAPAPTQTSTGTPRALQEQASGQQQHTVLETQFVIPAGLRIQPWKHQVEGYQVAMRALRQYHGALLAAQMGCGKSLVATMLALGLDAKMILVACPLRVIGSWRDQLAQYISGPFVSAPLVDDIGSVAKRVVFADARLALARTTRCPFYLLVNYDVLWRPAMSAWLMKQKWDLVIYDESHRLKTPGGKASLFAKRFYGRAIYRVLTTGTPLAHCQLDAFGQFRAIAPSVFGMHYGPFKGEYAVMGGLNNGWVVGYRNEDRLAAKMAPLTWRCTKREALPDLPEEIDVEFSTELGAEAARIYRQLERDMITQVEGHTLTAANCLTKVLRLQQLTGGSLKTDDGGYHQVDDSKRNLLEDTLEDLGDQPMVIFCRFRSDIDASHAACARALPKHKDKHGHDLPVSLELSGKRNELERWQAGEGQALVVQMQSGSVGISLVRASVAIYFSVSTSLVEYDQSRSRIHRPGQKENCQYIYLTCTGTIDQKILAALRARQDVIESIMQSIAEKAKTKEQPQS